jgi:MFS family permease
MVANLLYEQTLSIQAVVIILPIIGDDLGIPESRLQWIVSAHALTFGCFLLLWGRIADIYGKRLIFVAGSAWVAVITAANPFIPNEVGFNVFRGLQGLVSLLPVGEWELSAGEQVTDSCVPLSGSCCKCTDGVGHSWDDVPAWQGKKLCV